MQYTENYSLKLPGYGDNADVGDLNDNTTAIDALIHANRQIEAPAFSTETAYTAGDMCVYENVLYKFTSDKAAGNWDSTKVTATNLADEVTDAAQSGGTEVEANPVEAATADLHKLKVDTTVYGIPDPTVTKTATGNPIEFRDGADAPLVKCVTTIQGYQEGTGTPSPDNVRPIHAYTQSTISIEDENEVVQATHTATFSNSIYQGNADFVGGEVTSDVEVYEFTGNETIEQAQTNSHVFNVVAPVKFDIGDGGAQDIARPWSHFKGVNYKNAGDMEDGEARQYRGRNNWNFSFCNHNLSSVSDCATWLANQAQNGTPVQIAAQLATPTTSSITPTNLPIKSLFGYNHIESSTGDMEVEYITQTYQPLVDLIDEAATMEVYSTDEQEIGVWIDGSKLYKKTFTFTISQSGETITVADVSYIDQLVEMSGVLGNATMVPQVSRGSATAQTWANISNGNLIVLVGTSGDEKLGASHITLKYTKTSSNNRSLSKGSTEGLKADLSEEKKEIEESVDKVDKVDEPTETIEEKEENAGESNSENER